MSEPEEYTLPPGLRVASNVGNNPAKLAPVLINPSIAVVEGDIPTRQADGSWVPQAPSGGGSGVLVATAEISSTELLALDTVPKPMLTPPGTGRYHGSVSSFWVFTPGSTPYDVSQCALLVLEYPADPPVSAIAVDACDPVLLTAAAGDPQMNRGSPQTQGNIRPNSPLQIRAFGPLSDGNGTLTVTFAYLVI